MIPDEIDLSELERRRAYFRDKMRTHRAALRAAREASPPAPVTPLGWYRRCAAAGCRRVFRTEDLDVLFCGDHR